MTPTRAAVDGGRHRRLARVAAQAQTLAARKDRNILRTMKWLPPQVAFHRCDAPEKLLRMGNQGGKAQPNDAKVLTPTGWRLMGDLRVGDQVIAGDGSTTVVTGVFPQGMRPIVRMTFDDGATTRCDLDHLWVVKDRAARFRPEHSRYGQWGILTAREILHWGQEPKAANAVAIPVIGRADPRTSTLPLDPYLLGALIGDGGMSGGSITLTSADQQVVDEVAACLPAGAEIVQGNQPYAWRIRGTTRDRSHMVNPVLIAIRQMGLDCTGEHKFIPPEYLFAGSDQRLALLQGLMDTDGSISAPMGMMEYSSTSQRLAEDVQALVRSLGGKASVSRRQTVCVVSPTDRRPGAPSYRVRIRLPGVDVFRLERKRSRRRDPVSTCNERVLRTIVPDGEAECRCISVAHPSRTYVTDDYIVTHNTWAGLAEMVWRCLGEHPFLDVPSGPIEAWIVCTSHAQSINIQGKLWELLPKDEIVPGTVYNPETGFRGKNKAVRFKNGSIIRIKTTRQGALNLAGATIDVVLVDELTTRRVYTELLKRVMRRGGVMLLTLTPINADSRWLQERVDAGFVVDLHYRFEPANFIPVGETEPIRIRNPQTGQNVPADAAWVAAQIAQTPEDERDTVCHGEWPSGDVERELRGFRDSHIFRDGQRLPEFVRLALAFDHGERAGREIALLLGQAGDGRVWCLGEYASTGSSSLEDDARAVRDLLTRRGLTLADVDIAVGDINSAGAMARGVTVNEVLNGLFVELAGGHLPWRIRPATKGTGSVDDRTILLNSALASDRIRVHESCKRTIDSMRRWKGQRNRLKDPIDAFGYGYHELSPPGGAKPRAIALRRAMGGAR